MMVTAAATDTFGIHMSALHTRHVLRAATSKPTQAPPHTHSNTHQLAVCRDSEPLLLLLLLLLSGVWCAGAVLRAGGDIIVLGR
jgi:hypothetical protein